MKNRHSISALRKAQGFSGAAVVTIILLLVIVSILSIAFYHHALNSVKPKFVVNEGTAASEVVITITKVPGELDASQASPDENNVNT